MRLSPTRAALAAARTSAFGRLVGLLECFDRHARPLLPILTYHRVVELEQAAGDDPSLISATPDEFALQMEYLAASRQVLSLADLLAVRRGEMELPPGAVAVTFDDAYWDFAEYAWPVLRRLGLPVTLFVPTAFASRPEMVFWWDRLYGAFSATDRRDLLLSPVGGLKLFHARQREEAFVALRDWVKATPHELAMSTVEDLALALGVLPPSGRVLGWTVLRGLADAGVELAPHTRTHPRLDQVTLDRAQEEVTGAAADLRREIGQSPPVVAFPSGGHTERLVDWLSAAGFEIAFTTARGSNDPHGADWLRLRRINVGRRSAVPAIRAQLLSWPARTGPRRLAARTA